MRNKIQKDCNQHDHSSQDMKTFFTINAIYYHRSMNHLMDVFLIIDLIYHLTLKHHI
jgi:hypothetical protein